MMTNGPAARIGEILNVPFDRPRDRNAVLDDPNYDHARQRLISFLEDHAQATHASTAQTTILQSTSAHLAAMPQSVSSARQHFSVRLKSNEAV